MMSLYDLMIFANLSVQLINSDKLNSALEHIELAKQYKPLLPRELMFDFALFNYYEMIVHRNLRSWSKLKEVSQETLSFLEPLNGRYEDHNLVNSKQLEDIEKFARFNLRTDPNLFSAPITRGATRKYGRNEKVSVRYQDGTIKRDIKFKHIESDLVSKRCVLLEK